MSSSPSGKHDLGVALALFAATCLSTLFVGAAAEGADFAREGASTLLRGVPFALPLMTILLGHELGHYVAAKIHRVDVSPPYFIPFPLGILGTFGAFIRMRARIERRDALLDIGAAGPLVGFVLAVPTFVWGVAHSSFIKLDQVAQGVTLGDSLLSSALIYLVQGPTPAGHDLLLHPTALAGWAGLLVTMINLVPAGQLDGGHIAYALFGTRQGHYSRWFRRGLLPLALIITAMAVASRPQDEKAWTAGLNWFVWWALLSALARFSGEEHPTTEPAELGRGRRVLAWLTLALFPLLFIPTWISQ